MKRGDERKKEQDSKEIMIKSHELNFVCSFPDTEAIHPIEKLWMR